MRFRGRYGRGLGRFAQELRLPGRDDIDIGPDVLEVDLGFEVRDGHLHVTVPAQSEPVELTVAYRFAAVSGTMNGWDPQRGVTFLWPYFCSNLFPCRSDPSEGSTFTLSVSGVPAGRAAVYPERIPADAPSYQPAIAVGRYTEDILGTTTAGTEVGLWFLPTGEGAAREGTRDLVEVFDFLEQTYGPYTFGPRVGSVAADWGGGDFGGMEHHPLWHVSTGSMRDPIVHAHEAAHGWYGDGVRIECWEDFVLSEGVTSYLAARALEEVGFDPWPSYGCQLRSVCTNDPPVVLPESAACSEIDILHHELWSTAPYMKGAFFLRAVAEQIGVEAVDEALAAFYAEHVGRAATMDELIDALAQRSTPGEVESLADAWLRARACPIDANTLCG